jgi:hypothetical protein
MGPSPNKSDFDDLVKRLSNGDARREDITAALAHVLRVLEAQVANIREHDHWIWAAKGALALTVVFIGLIVYVFNDVREELRRKVDAGIMSQQIEAMDRHLSYIDGRLERLRDMLPAPQEHRGP